MPVCSGSWSTYTNKALLVKHRAACPRARGDERCSRAWAVRWNEPVCAFLLLSLCLNIRYFQWNITIHKLPIVVRTFPGRVGARETLRYADTASAGYLNASAFAAASLRHPRTRFVSSFTILQCCFADVRKSGVLVRLLGSNCWDSS
jgi:hypothetical protein